MCFNCFWSAGLLLAAAGLAAGSDNNLPVPPHIAAAVADVHRPAEQIQADSQRKPALVMAFAGVKAGDRVADFMPGSGYFTRILSKAVGPSGKVYAFIPDEQIKNCPPAEVAGARAIARDPIYRNVTLTTGPRRRVHCHRSRRFRRIGIARYRVVASHRSHDPAHGD